MDPFSIAAACVGLLSGLTAVSTKIRSLTTDARNANKEIIALQSELDSFQRSLGLFYGSGQADRYPENLRADLEKIIRECRHVVSEIDQLLDKITAGNLSQKLQWSLSTRDEVLRLHRNLEGHKSAISIAIAFASMSMNTGIKSDTSSIRSKAARIPAIQDQLAAVLEALQSLGDEDPSQRPQLGLAMQRFLQEAYAESVNGSLLRSGTLKSRGPTVSSVIDPFEDPEPSLQIRESKEQSTEDTNASSTNSSQKQPDTTSAASLSGPFASDYFDDAYQGPYLGLTPIENVRSEPNIFSYARSSSNYRVASPSSVISESTTAQSDVTETTFPSRQTSNLSIPILAPTNSASSTSSKKRFWQRQQQQQPLRVDRPHVSRFLEQLTSPIDQTKLLNVAALLEADPKIFTRDPDYHRYKIHAQDLYKRSLVLAPSTRNPECDAAFQNAVDLHNMGNAKDATLKAKRLAETGHTSAQIMYALATRYGRGCRCDMRSSLAYLYAAARVSIQLELQDRPSGPFFEDVNKADELRLALHEIADTFRHTWADSVSAIDAQLFYKATAELGDQKSMQELGWCYAKGFGVEKDKVMAAQILRKTDQGGRNPMNAWIWKDKYNI